MADRRESVNEAFVRIVGSSGLQAAEYSPWQFCASGRFSTVEQS